MKSPLLNLVFLLVMIAPFTGKAQRANQGMGPLLERATVKEGDTIPNDLSIYREDGSKVSLFEIVNGKTTVLVSGCLTCPIFHRTYSGVEAVYADYKEKKDVQFFFMYKSLAHPELNGYVQPVTLEERLAHVVEAKRVLGTTIPWLSDGVDNVVRHTLGFGPNTQIVIDGEGEIVHSLGWSDGEVLRDELVSRIGKTDTITRVADLDLKRGAPNRQQRSYEGGVLPKPTFSSEMVAIKLTPKVVGTQPLYVKPRIEVQESVLNTGKGELYLGFFMDPIHHVHWNNLADPLRYELKLSDGTVVSPASGTAQKVTQESDGDPREFKLDVSSIGAGKSAELVFHYFACSDKEGWCIPVTQSYAVSFVRDLDGGGTNGRSFRFGGSRPRGAQRGGPGGGQRGAPRGNAGSNQDVRKRIMEMDADEDGKISQEEATGRMREMFSQADTDEDGFLDRYEVDRIAGRMGRQGNPPRGNQPRGNPNGNRPTPADIKQRILDSDVDGDGKIALEELPEQMKRRFERMDADGNGFVNEAEIDEMLKSMPAQGQGGGGGGRPRGGRN